MIRRRVAEPGAGTSIWIYTSEGEREVVAEGVYGDFAIHTTFWYATDRTLTHIPSGLRVCRFRYLEIGRWIAAECQSFAPELRGLGFGQAVTHGKKIPPERAKAFHARVTELLAQAAQREKEIDAVEASKLDVEG